ncbi:hypothetical protein COV19_02400 [Candidatus Woesearchaeota archaeon CG10_big_fil_rev_8_21_14_0_10_44_13]|nr:MAG: hypothetical protein COV19_02400 [Candidatus Woesearchaeota archaeon CG10_big_fil_rev_8_21_14_0_10_44_13]
MVQQKKRLFTELRNLILENVVSGQKTLNQIASETGINWKTVDNHMTFLIGKGLAKEVFSSRYVRIVEATEKGIEQAGRIQKTGTLHKNATKTSQANPVKKFEKKGEVNII